MGQKEAKSTRVTLARLCILSCHVGGYTQALADREVQPHCPSYRATFIRRGLMYLYHDNKPMHRMAVAPNNVANTMASVVEVDPDW